MKHIFFRNSGLLLRVVFLWTIFLVHAYAIAQLPVSVSINDTTRIDSSQTTIADSVTAASDLPFRESNHFKWTTLKDILETNFYLNIKKKPEPRLHILRKTDPDDWIFYFLLAIVFIFALLKFAYPRYFANLFRVFFNTSLRQGQLTDQLLQAKLPSLFFNVFFVLIGSWYLYLLLDYFGKIDDHPGWQAISFSAIGLTIIYLSKFIILKFTGWITGFTQEADTYIFIVFLINKIVAVCLIPLTIVLAFSGPPFTILSLVTSLLIIGFMLMMRFIRSYSLLQNRLKVSRFHFFVYIAGVEIMPLLLIYKLALLFITKKV